MNRKIKALGLALVAALALTAVMASAAQAEFTSDKDETYLHGNKENPHVFTAGGGIGSITCSTATFEGEQDGNVATLVHIDPTYSGCSDSLGRTVHIDDEGLSYTFTTDETIHVNGTMTLTVTSSSKVVCTITIHAQTIENGVSFTNLGGTKGITVEAHAEGVHSTVSGGFFNCGTSNPTPENGTYFGNTVITGEGTEDELPATIKHDDWPEP